MFKLDLIQTTAFAGVLLFAGYGIRRLIPLLGRYNLPAPVIGGLAFSALNLILRTSGITLFVFDTTLQTPLMIAFFTSIGFGASLSLLKKGGPQVMIFFIISTIVAVLQNLLGIITAPIFGLHPLFGVLTGSVTLTGGPATGLAFAPIFEQSGVTSAASVAIASAMVGIVSGGLIGGPIGTYIIERNKLRSPLSKLNHHDIPIATEIVEDQLGEQPTEIPQGEDKESYTILKSIVVIFLAMWSGSWVSSWFVSLGITLPAYIGAMLIASIFRNFDDRTKLLSLSQKTIDDLSSVALSLFITMALMTLKLWELVALALPMIIMLLFQVILIAVICIWIIHKVMGKDYDAAVMSSGFCGFMLGTTANAMANMEALAEKYGQAPRAFLVVPMVGAFFIDFTNAVIITVFVNMWK
ncbi:MAG: sodium/glutamate symporter [Bacillota bacterium]